MFEIYTSCDTLSIRRQIFIEWGKPLSSEVSNPSAEKIKLVDMYQKKEDIRIFDSVWLLLGKIKLSIQALKM